MLQVILSSILEAREEGKSQPFLLHAIENPRGPASLLNDYMHSENLNLIIIPMIGRVIHDNDLYRTTSPYFVKRSLL